ncbi:hypothetical protein AB6806_23800 [Bosea sp. RCC_152_1]|uniref:hypothetical protein n=1 Tax=Bosea sp. RCC_152_1 TaxID=3239228 RepID=UPI0035252452
MSQQAQPLVFVNDPEEVMSGGFLRHDLSAVSAVFIVRPGVDPVDLLVGLAAYFSQPVVQEAVKAIGAERKNLQ